MSTKQPGSSNFNLIQKIEPQRKNTVTGNFYLIGRPPEKKRKVIIFCRSIPRLHVVVTSPSCFKGTQRQATKEISFVLTKMKENVAPRLHVKDVVTLLAVCLPISALLPRVSEPGNEGICSLVVGTKVKNAVSVPAFLSPLSDRERRRYLSLIQPPGRNPCHVELCNCVSPGAENLPHSRTSEGRYVSSKTGRVLVSVA